MALATGSRLGPYEVLTRLGEGGMGDVWLARDTRLDRHVAIKAVKNEGASDSHLRARVEQEARVLAQLTHPHICTLHDLVQHEEQTFLVMEALDGITLAARLERTQGKGLRLEECLTLGAQIADALAFAHQHGVVHQDVKPANIMLTRTGAKLLDFGVAQLRRVGQASGQTATVAIESAYAGTLPYMAPEQLDGRSDSRSDLFALGATLYEMLTGARAFAGATPSALVAQIVEHDPPALPPAVPPGIRRVVSRCLAKDPGSRWQSAADLADELRWQSREGQPPPLESTRAPERWTVGRLAGIVLVVAAFAGLAAWAATREWRSPPSPTVPMRAELMLPPDMTLVANSPPAISPDRRFLAFAAVHEAVPRVYVRELETGELRVINGTENAAKPFWSPDGASIAFFAGGQLKRVARGGGSAHVIAEGCTDPAGGDWSSQDVILFVPNYLLDGALWRVAAAGGNAEVVRRPDRQAQEQNLSWPRFLSDGRSFLYVRDSGRGEDDQLMVGNLDGSEPKPVAGIASAAVPVDPGMLMFIRNRWIIAQPFDAVQATVHGSPTPVAGPVEAFDTLWTSFDAKAIDQIVFRPQPVRALHLAWYGRDGTLLEDFGPPVRDLFGIALNRSATRFVAHKQTDQTDLWLWDLQRRTSDRLTSTDDAWETGAALSDDGDQLAFGSDERGTMDLYVATVAAPGTRRLLASAGDAALLPGDWSRDNRMLVGTGLNRFTEQDLWSYSLDTGILSWLVKTPAHEGAPKISPDGRWVAYQSDESGPFHIYVTALPAGTERWLVSESGGTQPRWRGDGKEIFYIGPGDEMQSVPFEVTDGRVQRQRATRLFKLQGADIVDDWFSRYGVSPDGQRFLIARQVSPGRVEGFALILGWRPPTGVGRSQR